MGDAVIVGFLAWPKTYPYCRERASHAVWRFTREARLAAEFGNWSCFRNFLGWWIFFAKVELELRMCRRWLYGSVAPPRSTSRSKIPNVDVTQAERLIL